ncbi:MAG TPA: hypothetical protein VMS65_04645, partial [Polyangiaceae bacterium]|nr:hypothetical protein [Polyangiaceae bacterium]
MWKPSSARAVVIGTAAAALVFSARALPADVVASRVPVRVVRARPTPRLELPVEPAIAWQARVLEPILGAPVADGSASLIVAHESGTVVELDANGRTRAAIRAGSSLALGPYVLASRRRVVVTG